MGFTETENEISYQIKDPSSFIANTFRRIKVPGVTNKGLSFKVTPAMISGVTLVVAKPKSGGGMAGQSYKFSKKAGWDKSKAGAWITRQKNKPPDKQPGHFRNKGSLVASYMQMYLDVDEEWFIPDDE
jgi:hypothetical protein